MANQPIDYVLRLPGEDKFEVVVEMHTTNKMFKGIFKKSAMALNRTKLTGVDPKTDISFIEQITVKKSYYPIIKPYMHKIMKKIQKECGEIEQIKFVGYNIEDILCKKREDGNWIIYITYKGNFMHV